MLKKKGIQMVSNKMDLPLLMASRNRIRRYQWLRLKNHLKKYSHQFQAECDIEYNTEEHESFLEKLNKKLYTERRNLSKTCSHYSNAARKYYEDFRWKIPPNIYHIDKEPFESRKGQYGALWTKSPRFPPRHHKRYESIRMNWKTTKGKQTSSQKIVKIDKSCNKYKYKYFGNASKNRYIFTIHQWRPHRGALELLSSTLYAKYQEQLKKSKRRTPFEVYKDLLVSVKYDKLCDCYTNFSVGPGRYETRFRHSCPCPKKRIYHPNLNDLILNHLHAKWLGLKPHKIDFNKYCNPEWMDIAGHGHCHLFKLDKSKIMKVHSRKFETVPSLKRVSQAGALKYILAMKSVQAKVDSNLSSKLPSLPPRIKYNIFIKNKIRKTISLKNIAFGSSLSRFPASGELRPVVSTTFKYFHHAVKKKPCLTPKEITKKKFSHIKSTLTKRPEHLLATQSMHSHRPVLKFPDLPEPKILVFDEDTYIHDNKAHGFYSRPVNINDFLKNDAHPMDMSVK